MLSRHMIIVTVEDEQTTRRTNCHRVEDEATKKAEGSVLRFSTHPGVGGLSTLKADSEPDLRDMLQDVEVIVGIEFNIWRIALLSPTELRIGHIDVGNDF